MVQVECGENHTLMLVHEDKDKVSENLLSLNRPQQKIISIGNEYGESTDSYFVSSENRNNAKTELADMSLMTIIQGSYTGKVILLPMQFSKEGKKYVPFVKFIRAAYKRSAAISEGGQVFVWGTGFRNERISKPTMLFHDMNGIKDL